jgi:superfamily II DNA helicase RecQ
MLTSALIAFSYHPAFKKPDFRGRQREIMEAAVRGADVLVVAPTGMGKRCV